MSQENMVVIVTGAVGHSDVGLESITVLTDEYRIEALVSPSANSS
jgi:hypothetical protein